MFQRFISFRYLRRRTTALLAVIAVMFGVATLMTVLGIMEGYIERLQEMIRESESHLIIRSASPQGLCGIEALEASLAEMPEVVETAPFIEALAMYRSGRFNPCFLRGLDPERESRVTRLPAYLLRAGELDAILDAGEEAREPGEFSRRTSARARELVDDPDRPPLEPAEVEAMFSRERRREVFDRHNPALAGQFSRYNYSAIVVGLQFLTSRNLELGQIVHVLTLKPGNQQVIEGKFVVTGAFKTGDFNVDSKVCLVHNNRMKTLLSAYGGPEGFDECHDGLRIALDDYRKAEALIPEIQRRLIDTLPDAQLRDVHVRTWKDAKKIFLQAVKIEKWIMGFVVSLLNIFTSCIILLMLVLIVIEKTRDAGILLSLGATGRDVLLIFLINGVTISTVGTVLGLVAGTVFLKCINPIHDWIHEVTGARLFDPEIYLMDRIPTSLQPVDVILSVLPAIAFGLLASLVPAVWASRKDPIVAIHHE